MRVLSSFLRVVWLGVGLSAGFYVLAHASEQPTAAPASVAPPSSPAPSGTAPLRIDSLRQLTFEGRRSGEGYFSTDGRRMVFQSERETSNPFYQIYLMELATGRTTRVSPGVGKTTCAWIHPSGDRVMFASTHEDPEAVGDQKREIEFRAAGEKRRYSWDYDPDFDLYATPLAGGPATRLTRERGYDAEGSYSPDGSKIAFASNRHAYVEPLTAEQKERFERDPSSAMEIYIMNADGSGVRRLTSVDGYDGGPFFSPDGERVTWRRFSIDGSMAEIYTMNIDGTDVQQLTQLGVMSWAPFYHPSGDYLIFQTNRHGFDNFELYAVAADPSESSGPVRVTDLAGFDGLAVFAPAAWVIARTAPVEISDRALPDYYATADWSEGAKLRPLMDHQRKKKPVKPRARPVYKARRPRPPAPRAGPPEVRRRVRP